MLVGFVGIAASTLPSRAAEIHADARGAAISSEAEHVSALVDQLGDAKFAEREAAARELIAIGLPAYAKLKDAVKSTDPEVRFRAERILAEVRQRDFHRRLQAFGANVESGEEYDLPGWPDFRELLGDSEQTRSLFIQMQSEEPKLMQALDQGPRAVGELLNARALQMLQPFGNAGMNQPLELGSAAAILYLAGRNDVPISDLTAGAVYRVCIDEAVRLALAGGAYQAPLREMLSAWISREGVGNLDYQRLMLAMQYDLKAGLAPAVQILEQAGHPPHLRQQAMVAVAKFGDDSHIPLLERYLSDETQYGTRQVEKDKMVQTESRDVALAALLVLTKQSFSDYGMQHVTTAPAYVFIPQSCGFARPEDRKKALDQWRDYRAGKVAQKPQP